METSLTKLANNSEEEWNKYIRRLVKDAVEEVLKPINLTYDFDKKEFSVQSSTPEEQPKPKKSTPSLAKLKKMLTDAGITDLSAFITLQPDKNGVNRETLTQAGKKFLKNLKELLK